MIIEYICFAIEDIEKFLSTIYYKNFFTYDSAIKSEYTNVSRVVIITIIFIDYHDYQKKHDDNHDNQSKFSSIIMIIKQK